MTFRRLVKRRFIGHRARNVVEKFRKSYYDIGYEFHQKIVFKNILKRNNRIKILACPLYVVCIWGFHIRIPILNMTTEGVLVDTSQGPPQMMQPQQQQAPQQQMQQQTAMAAPPPSSGPMGAMLDAQQNGTNGTIRPQRGNSGDGCCDNARERAKDAVAKVAPCACKFL